MITTLLGRPLDKFEQIAVNSRFHRTVLVNPRISEFGLYAPNQLVNDDRSLTDLCKSLQAGGFCYYGVVGIIDGIPHTALVDEVDPATLAALGKRFTEELEAQANADVREEVEKWVFARWLNRLIQDNTAQA
jgi:hypothetical protein